MSLTDEDKKWISEVLDEKLEVLETKLLTEFHKWASPFGVKQQSHSAALRALDVQQEQFEERLKQLEKRQFGLG